jgi:hypothetical protein
MKPEKLYAGKAPLIRNSPLNIKSLNSCQEKEPPYTMSELSASTDILDASLHLIAAEIFIF